MPFGVQRQQAAGSIERLFVPDAGEDIHHLTLAGCCMTDSTRCQQGQV